MNVDSAKNCHNLAQNKLPKRKQTKEESEGKKRKI